MSRVPCSSAIGSLVYVMVCTKPDLAHSVSIASRFGSNLGKVHWKIVKWILQYLKGMKDVYLLYGSNTQSDLVGYADSDHGGDMVKRRSLTCYIFTLFRYVISWKSRLQDTITFSTTKSDYMSMKEGIKEEIWFYMLI